MEDWRSNRFKAEYLPLVRPFSTVPDLLRRVRDAGLKVAIASSAKKAELQKYLDIARIADLVDLTTSSDDVEGSKPAPDIFKVVLKKLQIEGADAIAIGDTPYDAAAAGNIQGAAKESTDRAVIAATVKKPGVVLSRPAGSEGAFGEHVELPKTLGEGGWSKRAEAVSPQGEEIS